MPKFAVPDTMGLDEFFSDYVPANFDSMIAGADLSGLSGKEVTLQYKVGDKSYCLKIKDGKNVEVIKGGIDKPMFSLFVSEDDFKKAITGKAEGVIDRFIDPVEIGDPKRVSTLMTTKGVLNVSLKQGDSTIPMTMVFNGEEKPAVSINLDVQDWVSMQKKETTGQNLFMNGKIKFTGDMVLLMKLQSLL
ncbi:MAG: SCP2 sterol-binding domain-containing protein [Desulfomonilia bacterium]|jgi:putative sterol carrier protein